MLGTFTTLLLVSAISAGISLLLAFLVLIIVSIVEERSYLLQDKIFRIKTDKEGTREIQKITDNYISRLPWFPQEFDYLVTNFSYDVSLEEFLSFLKKDQSNLFVREDSLKRRGFRDVTFQTCVLILVEGEPKVYREIYLCRPYSKILRYYGYVECRKSFKCFLQEVKDYFYPRMSLFWYLFYMFALFFIFFILVVYYLQTGDTSIHKIMASIF